LGLLVRAFFGMGHISICMILKEVDRSAQGFIQGRGGLFSV
jgi:hypothetical protein